MEIVAKFLAVFERVADALEVIAASKSAGADAPRTAAPAKETVKEPTAAEKKAAKAAAEKAAKAKVEADPLAEAPDDNDPMGGDTAPKEYTEKDVREILARLIDKDGRAAAFEVLASKGGGAKAFTDLAKAKYEDVYVECEERLA